MEDKLGLGNQSETSQHWCFLLHREDTQSDCCSGEHGHTFILKWFL